MLCFHSEVTLVRERGAAAGAATTAYTSYDEKPGIQTLSTTTPDLPPVPRRQRLILDNHSAHISKEP